MSENSSLSFSLQINSTIANIVVRKALPLQALFNEYKLLVVIITKTASAFVRS